jgi:hypothetical protein
MVGGSPMTMWPLGVLRNSASSSRVRLTCIRMPRAYWSRRLPASVGVTPRPLRCSKGCSSSTSSLRTRVLSADCAMESSDAALLKLPSSATIAAEAELRGEAMLTAHRSGRTAVRATLLLRRSRPRGGDERLVAEARAFARCVPIPVRPTRG